MGRRNHQDEAGRITEADQETYPANVPNRRGSLSSGSPRVHGVSKRPIALRNTGPLYLQPLQKPKRDIWFSHQAVSVNTINRFMKDITLEAGLQTTQKNFTNHTMRKTVVKKLKKAGVATRDIAAITGHKSEESLRDYDDNDISEHMQLSKIINPTAATASNPSCSHHTSDTSYYN